MPSIYDGELRQNHQFLIAACKNDTKTKIHQYSLTDVLNQELNTDNHIDVVSHMKISYQNIICLIDFITILFILLSYYHHS